MRSVPRLVSFGVVLAALSGTRVARSQPARTAPEQRPATGAPETEPQAPATPAAPAAASAEAGADAERLVPADLEKAPPPPTNIYYLQYGVALAAEIVSAPGPICDTPAAPCVLGPGGGIAVRAGIRGAGPLYIGIAYEMTKQDPNKLYRLGLLQQARVEGRYYLATARVTEPYASLGLGVAGYGNEWSVDTWGPGGGLGLGLEYQITRRTVVGVAASYRLLYFSRFTDTSGAARDPGIAQLLGIDVVLEQRDPFFTADRSRGAKTTATASVP